MLDYPNLIQESESDLRQRYKELTNAKLRERCEVLIWLKSGRVRSMRAAMRLKSRSGTQGQKLWNLYTSEGLSGYLRLNYAGRKSALSGKEELGQRLSAEGFSTINEAREWILQEYGIKYTENGLGNYFRRQKIKLKTGRPHDPKADEQERAVYKKNMSKN